MLARQRWTLLTLGIVILGPSCATILELDRFDGGGGSGAGGSGAGGQGAGGEGAGGAGGQPVDDWWDDDYLYRVKLTFDAVAGEAFDVPIVVPLTQAQMGLAQDGGADVCFVDADGQAALPHEVEQWGSDRAYLWTRVPHIASGSDDFIWLYLGGPAGTCPVAPQAVWHDYELVYHLSDSLDDGTVTSSAEEHDGVAHALAAEDQGPCLAGDGLHFGETGERIVVADPAGERAFAVPLGFRRTFEAWFKIDGQEPGRLAHRAVLSCGWDIRTTAGPGISAHLTTSPEDDCNNGSQSSNQVGADVDGEWHYIAAVFDRQAHVLTVYLDGAALPMPVTLAELDPGEPADLNLGGVSTYSAFPGWIDEVRFSHSALAPGRIALQWRNMIDDEFPAVGESESH